jgi:hypothetical protein
MPYTTEQRTDIENKLKKLSPEEFESLKQELLKINQQATAEMQTGGDVGGTQSQDRILPKVGRSLLAGAEGALLASQGKGLKEGILTGGQTNEYNELLKRETLKNQIDPSRRTAQMELDEINRKKREQQSGVADNVQDLNIQARPIDVQGQAVDQPKDETPPMFIEKPKGKNKYGIMEYETIENPEYKSYQKKQDKLQELDVKKAQLRDDLKSFFSIDDVLQQNRGEGLGRLKSGFNMKVAGFKQDSTLGRAVASHEAARKRLRVQLVRAAGDVGNINIVEQQAAEMMVPREFDDAGTAEIKRAYLKQIAQAIDGGDPNAVKEIINRFMQEDVYNGFIPEGQEELGSSKVNKVGRFNIEVE